MFRLASGTSDVLGVQAHTYLLLVLDELCQCDCQEVKELGAGACVHSLGQGNLLQHLLLLHNTTQHSDVSLFSVALHITTRYGCLVNLVLIALQDVVHQ